MEKGTHYTYSYNEGEVRVRTPMDTMNVANVTIDVPYDDRVKPLIDKLYSYEFYKTYTDKDYDDIVELVKRIEDIDDTIIKEIAAENNISYKYAEAYYYRFRDLPIERFLNEYSENNVIHNMCPRFSAVYHAMNGTSGYY